MKRVKNPYYCEISSTRAGMERFIPVLVIREARFTDSISFDSVKIPNRVNYV